MNGPLPPQILQKIIPQLERDYPAESCGILLASPGKQDLEVRPCRNQQDHFHKLEPHRFPRTSRNGYFMDPSDLFRIHKEMRKTGKAIRCIYHSHIDAGTYFSEEDLRAAVVEGEPAYPGVYYAIFSVHQGKAHSYAIHEWDPQSKTYNAIFRGELKDA